MSRMTSIGLALLLFACAGGTETALAPVDPADLVGTWRAVLISPGGELPFGLEIFESDGELAARARNGREEAPFSGVELYDDRVVLSFDWYDSAIHASPTGPNENGQEQLAGVWTKTIANGRTMMPFVATRGDERRFLPAPAVASGETAPITGDWAVEFSDESGVEPARGEFRQEGDRVLGTFLTPVGDYRYLEGVFDGGELRLSTFDGGHAFLFRAELGEDGTLLGDFWSRETYHATWTARPLGRDERVLPDAWSLAGLTNDEDRFRFAFPDLDGVTLSLDDPRFDDKVVVVNIFGSWCPNCNDKAPLLAEWHRRYGRRGLEMVGLAYEFTGDPARDREQVRRYAERHDIEFPLLLAGLSDKTRAGETLPDLTAVIAYPTSVFVGRDGKVKKIHSGFAGPGTGEHHEQLVSELESLIEELLGP